jgi:hypothetical protein
MIAKLVPKETIKASPGSIPTEVNKKNCRGTIINPPPTPNKPDAKPAIIPIITNPMKYNMVKILLTP